MASLQYRSAPLMMMMSASKQHVCTACCTGTSLLKAFTSTVLYCCHLHLWEPYGQICCHTLPWPLQSQMEQLAEATTKINKLITKLEQAKQQLDRAHKEIKELKEAAQVCGCGTDRRLGHRPMHSVQDLADALRPQLLTLTNRQGALDGNSLSEQLSCTAQDVLVFVLFQAVRSSHF